MNKTKIKTTVIGLIISVVCIGVPVDAEEKGNRVSYSPEDWPTRWSSAIHQQKTAKFPTRTNTQEPLTELPEAVSDQDLFFSPQQGRRMRQDSRSYSHYQPYSQQYFARKGNQTGRDSASAYLTNNRLMNMRQPQSYYGNSPYGYQNASLQTVMDPVLGHPSLVVPMSPRFPMNMWPFGFMSFGGLPYARNPYGAVPYGYPINNIGWRPQVGPW